jgi:hypothetical protein
VAAECLQRVGPAPLVVLNRGERAQHSWAESERTEAEARPAGAGGVAVEQSAVGTLVPAFAAGDLFVLPDSRLGAQLALGGREARGELGRAVAALADRCEAPGS